MIETEQLAVVNACIGQVWAYASDVSRWAESMPFYREHELIDADHSRWTLKVGLGGLVRTVKMAVEVTRWAGPDAANFSYRLEGDPVTGDGSYRARAIAPGQTEITLQVRVKGSGPMAPMWESLGKPVLPKFAKSFADGLARDIENSLGVPAKEKVMT